MPNTLEEIEAAVLLNPIARGELIRRLLQTFDAVEPPVSADDWATVWTETAEKRNREMDAGKVIPIDGRDVLQQWHERFP